MKPTRIMFVDTETNGKVKDKKVPLGRDTVDNWPRMIQLAWSLVDQNEEELTWGDHLVKPDGWTIPGPEVSDFWEKHNLTQARCEAEGKPVREVLELFRGDLQSADVLVAHNMTFDYGVIAAEMLRLDLRSAHRPLKLCTMESTVKFCRVKFHPNQKHWPGQKYAFPSLVQLYETLWPGSGLVQTHQAGDDIQRLRECFFELHRRYILRIPAPITNQKATP